LMICARDDVEVRYLRHKSTKARSGRALCQCYSRWYRNQILELRSGKPNHLQLSLDAIRMLYQVMPSPNFCKPLFLGLRCCACVVVISSFVYFLSCCHSSSFAFLFSFFPQNSSRVSLVSDGASGQDKSEQAEDKSDWSDKEAGSHLAKEELSLHETGRYIDFQAGPCLVLIISLRGSYCKLGIIQMLRDSEIKFTLMFLLFHHRNDFTFQFFILCK
jgi:hypothetical protein